jgi:glycosyltransferase involved in cell wall biosynthesis
VTKVLIIAFGNPDNVLSLCRNISNTVDVTLMFVLSGDHVRQGVLDINMESVGNGLHTDKEAISKIFGDKISNYISDYFRLWLLKTGTRKFIHKRTGLENFSFINNACSFINTQNFNIIHYNGTSGFMLYFLHRLKTKNRFWTLHDYKPHTGEENPSGDLLNRYITKYKFSYIQHYEYLRKEFVKHYRVRDEKVSCVFSGVFDVYNAFDNNQRVIEGKYILFFGRISKYKGLDTLLKAYSLLPEKIRLPLVIAGSGPINKPDFLDSGIMLINDYISPEKLVSLVKNSEFVIAPYSDATHSGVIMTAYNFRKPVIATNLDGLNEVVINTETGVLFRKEDAEDLKNKIDFLLKSADLTDYHRNIEKLVKTGFLSWTGISNKMAELYSGSLN